METRMELDELKAAWQSLERRLEQDTALRRLELRMHGSDRIRGRLRPLFWGQLLQMLFGIAMMLLGVACWTRHLHAALLLGSGLLLHAYGLLLLLLATRTLVLLNGIDFGQPVVAIQSRLARLRAWHLRAGTMAGLPWWVLWLPFGLVLVGISPLPVESLPAGAFQFNTWVWACLATGAAGLVVILGFYRWSGAPGREALRRRIDDFMTPPALREAQAQVAELARFEAE